MLLELDRERKELLQSRPKESSSSEGLISHSVLLAELDAHLLKLKGNDLDDLESSINPAVEPNNDDDTKSKQEEEANKRERAEKLEEELLDRVWDTLTSSKLHLKVPTNATATTTTSTTSKPKTKEYLKLMETLRIRQMNEEVLDGWKDPYGTGTSSSNNNTPSSFGEDYRLLQKQTTGIINVFFSMAAVFTAFFYLGELAHIDLGLRVLFGLAGALITLFAEGWFYAKDLLSFDVEKDDTAIRKSSASTTSSREKKKV